MIKLEGLSKVFHNNIVALDNVHLEIAAGEFVAILGRSGAGKSTLVRCINGLVKPDKGDIWFNDQKIDHTSRLDLKAIRKATAMIFQQFNLIERKTAKHNVLMGRLGHSGPLSLLGLFTDADHTLALECLKRVGLESHAEQMARNLSGGQQQRVAIARALAQQAQVLLGDEPVASLDPVTARAIISLIKEINRGSKLTVVLNMHSVELSLEYADRIIGLKNGKVVFDGAPSAITKAVLEDIYV